MSDPLGRLIQMPSSGGALKAYVRDGFLATDAPGPTFRIGDSAWVRVPSIWRLRLTGTGTCTIDARDSLGNVTTGVESFAAAAATDQIEFPYAGDDAIEVRFTLTDTCKAEVL